MIFAPHILVITLINSILQQIPGKLKLYTGIGFALRFVATFFSSTAPDYVGYRLPIAQCISEGNWLYCDCSYNHTPFYPYLSALMNLLSGGNALLQSVLITFPLALGDALVPIAIYFLFKSFKNEKLALTAGIVYALNPLSIIEVGIAHWDGFTTFFLLISLIYMNRDKMIPSGVAAGFGVLLKQFPLAVVLISFARDKNFKNALLLGITTVGVVLLGFLPFILKCPDTFVQNLLSHPLWRGVASTGVGIGTVKSVFQNIGMPFPKMVWLGLFAAMLAIPFFKTNQKNYMAYAAIVLVTLGYFTFVTHRQLIVWCLPFLIIYTLEKKAYIPFVLVFVGYAIRIIKPDWYFGLVHLGVGAWYYVAFFKELVANNHSSTHENQPAKST